MIKLAKKIIYALHRVVATFFSIFCTFFALIKNPEVNAIMGLTFLVIIIGALFYMYMEGFSSVDAVYFTIVTLTTVGYGDITPQTEIGKIFTSVYILVGVGILVTFVQVTAKQMLLENEKNKQKIESKKNKNSQK